MLNRMKPLLSVAAGLVIGLLFGSATSGGAEANARAAEAHAAITATLPAQRDSSPACRHEEPSVYVGCNWFFAEGTIASVDVTVTTNNGRQHVLTTGRGHPDAIFLTRDAALRFLAPYYCCEDRDRVALLGRLRETVAAASTIQPR